MESTEFGEPLTTHLEELRKALLQILVGLGVGVLASFFFAKPVLEFLAGPAGGIQSLQSIEVTETISVYMRVALLCGVIVSLPWTFYQVFRYISKGLLGNEKRRVYFAIPVAVLLFLVGAGFAYFIMLPSALNFFITFLDVETSLRLKSYLGFVTNLVFWVGASFELPLIFFVLARLGIVDGRTLWKGWRIALVAIAVLAAVITPTADPVNMVIFMLPLFGLYLLSIGLAAIGKKKTSADAVEEEK